MNIAILGAGNIGSAMAAIISKQEEHKITVYTSKPQQWGNTIKYGNMISKETKISGCLYATNNIKEATESADVVFVTVPSFLRKGYISEIERFVRAGCVVIFVPGCGGIEFCCEKLLEKGCIVAGTDRVPCVSRIVEYGKEVRMEWKSSIRLAALKPSQTVQLCEIVSGLLELECIPLKNYLAVTLTPSNQIMHPVRLYSMFQNALPDSAYAYNIPFYGEWDDNTSRNLLKCDRELQEICSSLKSIDLEEVIPLSIHYESDTPEKMTQKIRSIESFKKVESPMIRQEDGTYKIDLSSRYFQEDFPYGLCNIKSIALICGVKTELIDDILKWYQKISGKDYFGDGKWNGADLKETNIPQNYCIKCVEQLYRFYGTEGK